MRYCEISMYTYTVVRMLNIILVWKPGIPDKEYSGVISRRTQVPTSPTHYRDNKMAAALLTELSTLPADQPTRREACLRCRYQHHALYIISCPWLAHVHRPCCLFITDVHFVCASVTAFPVNLSKQTRPSLSYNTPTRYTPHATLYTCVCVCV